MKSSDRQRGEQDRADATLATVDAALDSGVADDGDERERPLGRLALTLRAGAPEPSAAFEAKLERELGAGFASKRANGAASATRGARARRQRGAKIGGFDRRALGAFAVALLALAVGGGLLATVSGRLGGDQFGGGGAAPMIAPGEGGSSGSGLRSPPPDRAVPSEGVEGLATDGADGFAPGQAERRIERTASLTLAAPEERIDTVADGVVSVTDRHRGFVVTSSTSSGEDEEPGGSFDLRVPVEDLRATLSDLAALGTVRAQSQTGDDLTEPFATTEDRLDGARAERRSLLRRLERADTDREARALRAQLDLVSGDIRGLRGELRGLEERTDYARVSVTLTDEGADGGADGAGSSTGEALDDALGTLLGALNLFVRGLGVAIPLVLVAGATWLAFGTLRRRRREGALS